MLTTAIVIGMSLKVPDSKGHLNVRKMPEEEALAVATRCLKTSTPVHCASLLATLSFRESGNNDKASHDGGKGCGAFGALCTYPHATWQEQVDTAWSLVLKSTVTCEEPLALYVSGDCNRGHAIAREYLGIARRIAKDYSETTETARPK